MIFYVGNEEIDDIETFLSLNDNDFTRIKMTTKMIKIIQKIQKDFQNSNEEWIIEEVEISPGKSQSNHVDNTSEKVDPDNPYKGISLEKVSLEIILVICLNLKMLWGI